MRKIVVFGLIIFILTFNLPQTTTSQSEDHSFQVIPDDAIRLRILANSDSKSDQRIKDLIRDEVSDQISSWVEQMTDLEEAQMVIQQRIPQLQSTVTALLEEENYDKTFDIEYRSNVTFPAKLYDTVIYPAGEYEAVLITIGEGEGKNWWCVLFPPLCFLDFGHGSTVEDSGETKDEPESNEEDEEGIKIKFFLFEWFGWA